MPSDPPLDEQIEAVKRIIAESRGAVFNSLTEDDRDALRAVLRTLEGLRAKSITAEEARHG